MKVSLTSSGGFLINSMSFGGFSDTGDDFFDSLLDHAGDFPAQG
jgi:hypothetical protein